MKKVKEGDYQSFSKMGFISLEEVDEEESLNILANYKPSNDTKIVAKTPKALKTPKVLTKKSIDLPEIDMNKLVAWQEYNLPVEILAALGDAGFLKPTGIQEQVLRNGDRDIFGTAPTGSGKTLAFLLPILLEIIKNPASQLVAVIIAPTRELALQISEHLKTLAKYIPAVQPVTLVGGLSQEKQERLLTYAPNILIGTPGRMAEILQGNTPLRESLKTFKFLVLDEADRLLDAGHFRDLDTILQMIVSSNNGSGGVKKRTLLFSATLLMGKGVGKLKKKLSCSKPVILTVDGTTNTCITDAVESIVSTDQKKTNEIQPEKQQKNILQYYKLPCLTDEKNLFLFSLLRDLPMGKKLVFVNSIESIRDLASLLALLRIPTVTLHAQMQQRQRLKHLDKFRRESNVVLVTSDVAARGLDIPLVECVIHYHVPRSREIFVHRSGRTARAGASGTSVALIAPHEVALFNKIVVPGTSVKEYPLATSSVDGWRKAVGLGERIIKVDSGESKEKRQKSWEEMAAEALGVDIPDDLDDGKRRNNKNISNKRTKKGVDEDDDGMAQHQVKRQRQELESLKTQLFSLLK